VKNLINGAMGLDRLVQGAFQHHNVGQFQFQLDQAARARDYDGDASVAGAGGMR